MICHGESNRAPLLSPTTISLEETSNFQALNMES